MPISPVHQQCYSHVLSFLKKRRIEGQVDSHQWSRFRGELEKFGAPPQLVDGIDYWILQNMENHHPESVRWRILQGNEKNALDTPSYGMLMDANNQGMLFPSQVEWLIEEVALGEAPPWSLESLFPRIVDFWVRNLDLNGTTRVH